MSDEPQIALPPEVAERLQQLAEWRDSAVIEAVETARAEDDQRLEAAHAAALDQGKVLAQAEALQAAVDLQNEYRREGREEAEAERERLLQESIASYRAGLTDDDPCMAPSGCFIEGVELLCGLAAGHPLGRYERHKAVIDVPYHCAIVWNEAETSQEPKR